MGPPSAVGGLGSSQQPAAPFLLRSCPVTPSWLTLHGKITHSFQALQIEAHSLVTLAAMCRQAEPQLPPWVACYWDTEGTGEPPRSDLAHVTMEHVLASPDALRAGTRLRRSRDITGSAAKGRTRWALLTRYTFGDNTIGSRGFIAAVTWTTWPRAFGGAGL
jgi:hypothetical protein